MKFKTTIIIFLLMTHHCYATDYFVDGMNGNDEASGKSSNFAWKSLNKVNQFIFKGGDQVLFRAGQRFAGTLIIGSSGSNTKPIIYSSFGKGNPAVIDAQGDSTSIYSINKEYFILRNLWITNHRNGEIKMDDLFTGILIINQNAGILHNIKLDKVRIFDVNSTYLAIDDGKTDKSKFNGGIQFYTRGNNVRSYFDNILITDCTFEDLSRTGLNFRSDWDDRSLYSRFGDTLSNRLTDNWTPNTNIIIRKNIFRKIAGNGLIVRVAVNPLIEYNLFDSCGLIISGNAAFNFNTDSCVYQYNEARHTVYNPGDVDARGIDSDYRTKHTIIQYNYLHDNEQGGVIATGGPGLGKDPLNFNYGTIIRYNILENNIRQGAYFSGLVQELKVYNNVFFANARIDDIEMIKFNKWTVYPSGAYFTNNIFYYEGKNIGYVFTNATDIHFNNNLYYGVKSPEQFADINPVLKDPLFMRTGAGTDGYKLQTNSPARGSGVTVKGNAGMDFYRNKINDLKPLNIGIDNK